MQKPLQAAGAIIDQLLLPGNLLQVAVIGGAVLLGWWIGRLVRPRLAAAVAPQDFRLATPVLTKRPRTA